MHFDPDKLANIRVYRPRPDSRGVIVAWEYEGVGHSFPAHAADLSPPSAIGPSLAMVAYVVAYCRRHGLAAGV